MNNPIQLVRYDPKIKEHVDLLWDFYKDEESSEFFRRISPTLKREDIENFEDLTRSQLFLCKIVGIEMSGFAIISSICWFGLSAQVGLMLYPKFRDETRNNLKLAFWAMLSLARILFDKMTLKRMSFKFLKKRFDIEKSLVRGGLRKEGEYKNSILYDGQFEDELEYCLDKDNYEILYK